MAVASVDDLLTMSDANVASRVPQRFLECLKAVPEVRPVFFADTPQPPPFPNNVAGIRPLDGGWLKTISVALVGAATTKLVVRNFNQLVDLGSVRTVLDRELAPGNANAIAASGALYDAEFGGYARSANGIAFQSYLADRPAHWGSELARTATSNTYRTQLGIKYPLATNEQRVAFARLLNLIVYMVGRLNAPQRDAVSQTLRQWYPQLFNETSISRLIRADYTEDTFFGAVSNAASKRRYQVPRTGGRGGAAVSIFYWGEAFTAFLNSQAGAYRTNVRPHEAEVQSIFSCFAAGTPVHLASGEVTPIEAVRGGDRLLADKGTVAVCTEEDSARLLAVPQTIYGINDVTPFVSAAHLFLTATGPRAIDAASASAINPDIPVGQLKVGDKLLRLAATQPVTVEEVAVERFTTRELPAGDSLFALVLSGPQSYFASGFLVAANYPALTEARIADGIAALTPAEREQLLTIMQPVMPLLLHVLRGFAGPRLTAILGGNSASEVTR